jgi:hypothetical protein
MNNQIVIVRDFMGKPLVRKVYGSDSQKVYVIADAPNPRAPIGFARQDVFFYNEKLLLELKEQFKTNPSLWKELTAWSEAIQ